ncbi:hypothetical protein HDU87_006116 [Geranomyces variabilis]|uniref:Delta(14)-sterol reductase ERG24 n=1 Tax=Geranomyces variabilis TaxID=109894 RepID=A0AAD5TIE0_9FUNG|nr:hypothetical protein HDU87_006116 [Geranomyces variabilis]
MSRRNAQRTGPNGQAQDETDDRASSRRSSHASGVSSSVGGRTGRSTAGSIASSVSSIVGVSSRSSGGMGPVPRVRLAPSKPGDPAAGNDSEDEEEEDAEDSADESDSQNDEEDVDSSDDGAAISGNRTTTHFEFLGPHGTVLVILLLPVTVFTLQVLCDPVRGYPPAEFYTHPLSVLRERITHAKVFSPLAYVVILGWHAAQAALHGFLPGNYKLGGPLPAPAPPGSRLEYKINALSCMVASYLALYALFAACGTAPFLWVADNMLPLAVASSTIALVYSALLYTLSHRVPADPRDPGPLLAAGGNSGYPYYDFWMGRELNPRLGGWFDLKYFCELRPGIIGWTVLNVCLAVKQHQNFGRLSEGMVLVMLFQGYYAFDALYNEEAILTTMDITTDGFGMMLCFGDLVWVPFTYSLQALYLAHNHTTLSGGAMLLIALLELFGIYIFRSANSEKDKFRTNPDHPDVAHLEYIDTARGTRLLTSGWWGLARHVNYFGDWLMALSWCLTTGFNSPIPYFYAVYFAILLMHREMRDETVCRVKYGADWDRYRAAVPYRFIPGVW